MRISMLLLGTGAPDAGPDDMPAVALRVGSALLLLDSGEGVQHKLVSAGLGLSKVSAVLVTHLHGDHVLGLVPLIQTRSLLSRSAPPLAVVGPPGIRRFLSESFASLYFDPGGSLEVQEVRGAEEVRLCGTAVATVPLDHTVETVGYVLDLGGDASVCYLTDTRPLPPEGFGHRCRVLVHDSTFSWADLERAREFKHSTALEAASFASSVGSGLLVLFHISSRYRDRRVLEREARRLHPHSYVAEKFMRLALVL